MRTFLEYVMSEDTEGTASVKAEFDTLKSQIDNMFSTLLKAANNTWGAKTTGLTDKNRNEIISDLEKIILRLKNDVKAESLGKNVGNLLFEANDLVAGMSVRQNSATGRMQYNMRDVLERIKNNIMTSVHGLEKSVLAQMISGVGQDVNKLRKGVGKAFAGIGGKVDRNADDIRKDVADQGNATRGDFADVGQRLGQSMDDLGNQNNSMKRKLGRIPGLTAKKINPGIQAVHDAVVKGNVTLANGTEKKAAKHNVERLGSELTNKYKGGTGRNDAKVVIAPDTKGSHGKSFDVQTPDDVEKILGLAYTNRWWKVKLSFGSGDPYRTYRIDLGTDGAADELIDIINGIIWDRQKIKRYEPPVPEIEDKYTDKDVPKATAADFNPMQLKPD